MWASIGFLVLLCGAWVLPDNKLYHQMLIFLLWLPALLALFHRDFRAMLKQPECVLFAIFAAWTLLVLMVEGGNNIFGKSKVTLYVALTLLGVLLAAQNRKWRFESMLLYASIIGGFFAAASWVYFYDVSAQPFSGRLIAIGLWDTAIMAAHAVGALLILGVFTLQTKRFNPWAMVLLLIPALGYALFLGFSQTRGVWIGLLACLFVMGVARPSRLGGGLIILVVLGLASIAVFKPDILLQRGVSFRPELWNGGVQLMLDHWAMGLGFHEYLIPVPEIGQAFKHPHNLFLDIGVRLGVPGLLLFGWLWLAVGWRGWVSRAQPLGQVLLALWVFSGASLMTDGIGLWLKPNADWLITWLPIALSIVLATRGSNESKGSVWSVSTPDVPGPVAKC
ncbi:MULTISPECIES: O-antigen ligase [Pseudomonas]|uniref:O-antigen ligase family protein n=1 Tax=Pseudomonas wuhanensis TaxID=2954098 RepID=A0ABY9GQJ3_9PSED|nr:MULTISPECIES: O-antigen ligase family protein [unclassified Pseudomonas]WLI12164.1 O-antigen ligase family protein [Pseudomonas sp. FP603]WLI18017.1 O-antigen ligase family protein [Pseudomonas sp. FP607]